MGEMSRWRVNPGCVCMSVCVHGPCVCVLYMDLWTVPLKERRKLFPFRKRKPREENSYRHSFFSGQRCQNSQVGNEGKTHIGWGLRRGFSGI